MLLKTHNTTRMIDDAHFAIKNARYVLYIDSRFEPLYMDEQVRGYRLDIFVVIGEVSVKGELISPCILLEIGLGPSRPYLPAKTPKHLNSEGVSRSLHKRVHFICLDADEFARVWPYVEYGLRAKAERQISQWEGGTGWTLSMSKRRMNHSTRTFSNSSAYAEVHRGVHISISYTDSEMMRVALCSEVLYYKKTIEKFAKYILICLRKYKQNYYSEARLKAYCRHPNSGLSALVTTFEDQYIGMHRIAYMVQSGLLKSKRELFLQVLDVFDLMDTEELLAMNMDCNNSVTFNPDTQVRILRKCRENQDYLVVELVPGLEGNYGIS